MVNKKDEADNRPVVDLLDELAETKEFVCWEDLEKFYAEDLNENVFNINDLKRVFLKTDRRGD